MIDTHQGWALVQQGEWVYVVRTEDGGRTWREASPPTPREAASEATALFWDERRAWVSYAVWEPERVRDFAVVWRTEDGGRTWQSVRLPMRDDEPLFLPGPLVSPDGERLWYLVHVEGGMQKDYAVLFASHDGGRTWDRIADPWQEAAFDLFTFYTNDLAFTPQGYGWATKDNGVAPGGVVVETRDGGRGWQGIVLEPPVLQQEPDLPCDTMAPHVWSPGEGTLLLTCPYGESPVAYVVHLAAEERVYLPLPILAQGMRFFTPQQGLIWGEDEQGGTLVYRTQDAGLTWERLVRLDRSVRMAFRTPTFGWAWEPYEPTPYLWYTQDGGRTWEAREYRLREP